MSAQGAYSVSVIIPCYNHAHFVGEAIESALRQTHAPFEIILVDDGSTDHTPQVAASYPGLRYIRQENQGLSAARNTGLRESKGNYLVFLDADDRLLPHALETGLECMKQQSQYAFVYGRCRLVNVNGVPLPTREMAYVEEDHYLELLRGNFICMTGMVMFRREIFDSVGAFNVALKASEDYDIYLRITRNFRVNGHDKVVAEYRQHGANMSHNPILMLKSTLKVHGTQWKYVKGSKNREGAYKAGSRHFQQVYGDELVNKLRRDLHSRKWGSAAQDALVLLRNSPRVWVRHAYRKTYCILFRVQSDFDHLV